MTTPSGPQPPPPPPPPPQHNRQELDPPTPGEVVAVPIAAPPERPAQRRVDDPGVQKRLDELIRDIGGEPGTFNASLIKELLSASLKLIPDGRDTGELKLITTAVKELRYAFRVFGQYAQPHKVSIFGSARTKQDHEDYAATIEFSKAMADAGWMVITGAGGGIMQAGHVGPGREKSFGVAIRLPFETTANEVIAGDEKLIHFRYFFTRKLMFLSQAEAVALFPGGFGTMDEAFEVLTLIQTGKSSMIPVVCCEGRGHTYWAEFDEWVRKSLLTRGLISPEDTGLYYRAKDPADAARHILRFYRVYHSSRYVGDDLVIRLNHRIRDEDAARLETEFKGLIKTGGMTQRGPYPVEDDHLSLPRLAFTHNRNKFGLVRRLVERINECEPG